MIGNAAVEAYATALGGSRNSAGTGHRQPVQQQGATKISGADMLKMLGAKI